MQLEYYFEQDVQVQDEFRNIFVKSGSILFIIVTSRNLWSLVPNILLYVWLVARISAPSNFIRLMSLFPSCLQLN